MNQFGTYRFGFTVTPWVKRLLIANAVVFFLLLLPGLNVLTRYLLLEPRYLLERPWMPLTYMFLHGGLWHLFFNMLILFFFGPPLESRWGGREFIRYYIICGLGGAVFSLFFAWQSVVLGASAAIYGLMLAFALNWPNSPIYVFGIFPLKAKWLVAILAFLALSGTAFGPGDGVAHFAHLGGFAAGFLYLKLDFMLQRRLDNLKARLAKPGITVLSGQNVTRKPERKPRNQDDERLLDEVDRLLDKISTSGLSSLSSEERKLLDAVSRRYRKD